MGLEAVELILTVEAKFNIELPDEELNITTVGDLLDLVVAKYSQEHPESWLPSGSAMNRTFYHLRQCLISELALQRKDIRPETPTSVIFPEAIRQMAWRQVSKAAKVKFPALRLPLIFNFLTKVLTVLFWVAMAGMLLAFCFILELPSGIWNGLLVLLLLIFLSALSILLIKMFAAPIKIPASCGTIRDLSRLVAYGNMDKFQPSRQSEIRDLLFTLIAEECGTPFESITREITFKELFPGDYR